MRQCELLCKPRVKPRRLLCDERIERVQNTELLLQPYRDCLAWAFGIIHDDLSAIRSAYGVLGPAMEGTEPHALKLELTQTLRHEGAQRLIKHDDQHL